MNWIDEIEYLGELGSRANDTNSADFLWREYMEGLCPESGGA